MGVKLQKERKYGRSSESNIFPAEVKLAPSCTGRSMESGVWVGPACRSTVLPLSLCTLNSTTALDQCTGVQEWGETVSPVPGCGLKLLVSNSFKGGMGLAAVECTVHCRVPYGQTCHFGHIGKINRALNMAILGIQIEGITKLALWC